MADKINSTSTGTNTLNAIDNYKIKRDRDAGEPEVQVKSKKESNLVKTVITVGAISAFTVLGAFFSANPDYCPFNNKDSKQTPAQYVDAKYNTDQNIAEAQARGLYFSKK